MPRVVPWFGPSAAHVSFLVCLGPSPSCVGPVAACSVTGVLRRACRLWILGCVRSIHGHVGLLEVVVAPSTLVCPCVATLGGRCAGTIGSPCERAAPNLFIICNHCCLPFTDCGISFFIFANKSAAASIVLSSSDIVLRHSAVSWVESIRSAESETSRRWNPKI